MHTTTTKKVLFLITKGAWGGAGRYVYDLATALPKETYEVVVACGAGDALPQKLAAAEVRCVRMPHLGRGVGRADIAAFCEIFSLIKKERPDILHLNSSKAAFLGVLASHVVSLFSFLSPSAPRAASKIITTVHGWPQNEPRPLVECAALHFLSWLTALLSHAVIVLCRADEASARRLPFIGKKTHLVPNGLAPFIMRKRGAAREALAPGITPKTTLIVTIAELTKNKGLPYALGAVALLAREHNLPPFFYTLIGEGELRSVFEKMIAEQHLEKVARLAGFVPDASRLLSGADIFLLPSLKEGLPYVLLEAGLLGVPAVATRVGGAPDIIDDMRSGVLIRPKREKEIADALRFLLREHKKREAFGAALREKILRDFSFEKMLSETITVYE